MRAYGENAATFLIFQALANQPGAMERVFFPRLKQFGTRASGNWPNLVDPQVWLFPNFGKRFGFGEPDVLIIAGTTAFWIEVETTVNGRSGIAHLRRALLQLWRFRLLQAALAGPREVINGHRRIVGVTLTDQLIERRAELVCKGHRVLQEAGRDLKATKDHHYVLFTINQPNGEGGEGLGYAGVLERELRTLSAVASPGLPLLERERCWYAYWRGDLETPFNEHVHELGGTPFRLDDCYVGKAT